MPTAQAVHEVDPGKAHVPAGHREQLVSPGAELYAPALHAEHESDPWIGPNVPAGQLRQAARPVKMAKVPGAHEVHEDEEKAAKVPA